MNSAVSIWFSQVKHFTDQGCDQAKIDFTPMNQVMVLWRFSGHGNLSQGHMDIHIVKRFLLMLADSEGKIWLNDFVAKYLNSESDVKRDVMREDERERQQQVIHHNPTDEFLFSLTREKVERLWWTLQYYWKKQHDKNVMKISQD